MTYLAQEVGAVDKSTLVGISVVGFGITGSEDRDQMSEAKIAHF